MKMWQLSSPPTSRHPQPQPKDEDLKAKLRAKLKKVLSLNIDTRRTQRESNRERALGLENERRAALGLEAIESLEDLDDEERPDIQLDQAAGIVTDLAVMREVEGVPAQTARVNP